MGKYYQKSLTFGGRSLLLNDKKGGAVAQFVSVRLSEQEVSGSILRDFNVCFDFPLIRVAIALNTRKTEHGGRGVKERNVGFH